jgi:hypothetical protein
MKKVTLLFALALVLATQSGCPTDAPSGAHASSQQGCQSGSGQAAGCSSDPVAVPEPSAFALLAVGLAVVGGLGVVLRRKRVAQK